MNCNKIKRNFNDISALPSSLTHDLLWPFDLPEDVTTTDEVPSELKNGLAVSQRPTRAGISCTYFFCYHQKPSESSSPWNSNRLRLRNINIVLMAWKGYPLIYFDIALGGLLISVPRRKGLTRRQNMWTMTPSFIRRRMLSIRWDYMHWRRRRLPRAA